MTTLSVKNLAKYQHYKHRNPPWIKLYREFWTDYTLRALPVSTRLLFIGLSSLAMEAENQIPYDTRYLSDRLGFKVLARDVSNLISSNLILSNLEEQPASAMLDPRMHDASKTIQNGHGKTGFPAEWKLDQETVGSWQKHGINPHIEFATFKDHALANDRRCKDWPAAFRNWCRKAIAIKETRR